MVLAAVEELGIMAAVEEVGTAVEDEEEITDDEKTAEEETAVEERAAGAVLDEDEGTTAAVLELRLALDILLLTSGVLVALFSAVDEITAVATRSLLELDTLSSAVEGLTPLLETTAEVSAAEEARILLEEIV